MSDNTPSFDVRFNALPEDMRESMESILSTLERDLKRKQKSKEERLEMLENGTKSLPVNERLAMHILGEMAMCCYLTINDVHGDDNNLYYLFRKIAQSLESGLKVADWREIKELAEQE